MARLLIDATGEVLSEAVSFAETRRARIAGLLAKEPLRGTHALVFAKTKQIHTFGMTYPLDVVFCDAGLNVLHVSRNVRPSRVSRWVVRARYAIEIRAGSVPHEVRAGTRLRMEPAS